jgi:glucan phosphoethanolaminetransferase (alkaline phosphatase superfamily)
MAVVNLLKLLLGLCILGSACVTPYFVLYFSVHRVKILKQDWRPALAKSVISLLIWLSLSFGMLVIIFFGFIYGDRLDDTPPILREETESMLFLFVLAVVYGLAGLALCYWAKGRTAKEIKEQGAV